MKCFRSIVVAVAICIPAVAAMAATVSYDTPISATGATTTLAPQLQQFNPSLGTLTGGTVTLNISITPIAQIIDFASPALPFTEAWTGTNPADAPTPGVDDDVPFTVTDPYNNTTSTDYSWNYGSGVANLGLNDFADPKPILLSSLISSVPSTSFSNYTGTGTSAFDYTTTQTASYQGSGANLFFGGTWSLAGTATVTYTYTPSPPQQGATAAPLPASAISGLILMGAMAIRKRRAM